MTRVILASSSESRRRILSAAGVPFEAEAPNIDEAAHKTALLARHAGADTIAASLAEAKAMRVSAHHPGALVLGCDQVLVCEHRLFDKVGSRDEARDVLRALRGKRHELITFAVLVRDEATVWRHGETARLWMHAFSDEFLEGYLVGEGEDILSAVGCYHVEGRGIQLFDRIEGDQFTIRGLPLLPLLQALREHGGLAA